MTTVAGIASLYVPEVTQVALERRHEVISFSSIHETIFIAIIYQRKTVFVFRLGYRKLYLSLIFVATVAPRALAWCPMPTPEGKVHAEQSQVPLYW